MAIWERVKPVSSKERYQKLISVIFGTYDPIEIVYEIILKFGLLYTYTILFYLCTSFGTSCLCLRRVKTNYKTVFFANFDFMI